MSIRFWESTHCILTIPRLTPRALLSPDHVPFFFLEHSLLFRALRGLKEPAVWGLPPFTSMGILCLGTHVHWLAPSFIFTYHEAGTVLGFKVNRITSCSPLLPILNSKIQRAMWRVLKPGAQEMKKGMSSFAWGWEGRAVRENKWPREGSTFHTGSKQNVQRHKETCSSFRVQVAGITGIISLVPELCVHQWIIMSM